MTMHVLVGSFFHFLLEPALSFHAQTPNVSYKLQWQGTTANLPNVFHQTVGKKSQRKVKIHLLVRRQMWTHWEAARAISSRVWFIIIQLLKHSPQMQVDSTFVTMKDFDTYWSQSRDMEWCCCSERGWRKYCLQNRDITPF